MVAIIVHSLSRSCCWPLKCYIQKVIKIKSSQQLTAQRSRLNPSQANKQLHLSFPVSKVPCGWSYLEEEPPTKPGLFLDWSSYLLQRQKTINNLPTAQWRGPPSSTAREEPGPVPFCKSNHASRREGDPQCKLSPPSPLMTREASSRLDMLALVTKQQVTVWVTSNKKSPLREERKTENVPYICSQECCFEPSLVFRHSAVGQQTSFHLSIS